jgi:predicted HAD superfamily Cof-like phosphohydrolase
MSDYFNDVLEFHKAFNLKMGKSPKLGTPEERKLRIKLIREEFNELLDAEDDDDIVEVADALADLIYIACGTAIAYGIPLNRVFDEVHRTNMAKLVDGKPLYREDGKVKKPEGWKPPDINKVLFGD